MLVTSSQISVAISSGIVFIFTTLLFLSGYVLQQQTVRSLQDAIHPKLPVIPIPTTNPVLAKHFGAPPGHSFYDKYLASNRPKGGWAKVAHVQLVRRHVHVCNAVMLFERLAEGGSMAQRVLMYPAAWDMSSRDMKEKGSEERRVIETSMRLLQRAANDYKVMLSPLAAVGGSDERAWQPEERYPLTNLLSLVGFNRLVWLPPSGLLLDADPMDLLFTLPMEGRGMLGLADPLDESNQPDILLIEPSKQVVQETISSLPEGAYPDSEFLNMVDTTPAPMPSNGENTVNLLAETAALTNMDAQFNATEFLEETAYVRVRDERLPGPEYGVPHGELAKAMPRGREAKRAWEGVYERYREARMEVCGLDLEPAEKIKMVEEELK